MLFERWGGAVAEDDSGVGRLGCFEALKQPAGRSRVAWKRTKGNERSMADTFVQHMVRPTTY